LVPWRQQDENPTSEIEKALAAGEFIPYYQPVVDITTGKLLGCEALVRWKKPDGKIIAPGAFIPLIESSGLILDLTRSLMRQVCVELGPIMEARPDMYVAFNIAPRHLKDSMVLNDVGAIFEGSPIRLSQVVLEVTERYELENLAAARRVIASLQALGCRIALDDVGTGHSGLSYILKLGVDIIKIDKLFVEAVKTDPHTQAIVATLVDLARNLHMKIIAEGVEEFEQVMYLREHGIIAAQGYCFAPPLPGSVFVQLVQAMDSRTAAGTRDALTGPSKNFASAVARIAAA
jgi:sensor c-di-GMP phosphodiesterase-like protein